eukprot:c8453_g1_i2.p1 GENE.c8453_g1_i2~~c8453_g1_i2.p1  ORF type:complete len:308 (-),score=69.35 c8453_g1_i2:210-1133(-)
MTKQVIITDVVPGWKAFNNWTREYLLEAAGDTLFSVGHFQMRLSNYYKYADTAVDDQPMYLFDKGFANNLPKLAEEYEVPQYFKEDFFEVLGPDRPDHRWLIIGPAKSGSTFHVDPNSTSAWNAVIRGSKKWVMYPPSEVPPGVFPSADGADVACPISLVEWFIGFYEKPEADSRSGRLECILREGELLFVPRGWWHCALNLEETVAITQNFVSSQNLRQVMKFVKTKPNQVSGVSERGGFCERFEVAMREKHTATMGQLDKDSQARAKRAGLFAALPPKKMRSCDNNCDTTHDTPQPPASFTFSFD